MDILFPSTKIYIAKSQISGLGVYARVKIKKDEIIEESPVLVIKGEQVADLTKTELFNYYFAWGSGFQEAAVAWGYGSLFNHSTKPNVKYIKVEDEKTIKFIALTDIEQDEEIVMNYSGHPGDKSRMWFEVR